MASPNPTALTEDSPRPTQAAFEPITFKQTLLTVALGALCLAGALLGLAAWYQPGLLDVQASDTTVLWMSALLPFIFPIFVPIAFYFWGLAWRDWRNSRVFERSRRITTGVITHLWVEPPRPPGKVYFVGYRFGQGQAAFCKVHPRTYSRLAVGQAVTVEYAAANLALSRLDWQKRASQP